MVQGFIFEGDLQFSKLFKNTICKGVCTVKCTEKRFIPFYLPPFSSLTLLYLSRVNSDPGWFKNK